jgi:HK97 family phage portal protein
VAVTPDVAARMTALRHAFDRPNRDDSFRSLIEQVLEDTLCGAGAIEQQLTGDPLRPVMLWPVDGLSIEVDAGWDGEAGSIRYRQSYSGIGSASVELTNDELIYIRPNPSTHTPFGLGPLEVAFQSIARQLAVADYAGKVAANTRPGLMLNLGPEIGIDQIQAFRSYWRNEVEGQGLMPIIGAGKEVQALRLTPEGDGALYLKYQDWIVREIASCFDLSPQNMGLERDVNRGTSETAQDRDWDQAIKPFAGLIAAHLNRDLIQGLLGDHDLEFRWTGLDRADEQATSEIWRTYYTTNVLTPNEMRTRLGLPKLTAQWGDLLYADAQIAISAARGTKRLDDPTLSDAATPAGTTQAYNQNHQPAGSPEGGQFAPGEGGGDAGDDKSAGQYLRDKLERDQGTEPDHSNNYDVADNGNTGKSDKETTAKPDIPKDISKDGADFIKNAESRGGKPNLKEYDD